MKILWVNAPMANIYSKTCHGCSKTIHFENVCRSTNKTAQQTSECRWPGTAKQGSTQVAEGHYTDDKWVETHEDAMRSLDSLVLKSFHINSQGSVILTELETSNKHERCQIAFKEDSRSDWNLLSIDYSENCPQIPVGSYLCKSDYIVDYF